MMSEMKVEMGERTSYLVCKGEGILALCVDGREAVCVDRCVCSHWEDVYYLGFLFFFFG